MTRQATNGDVVNADEAISVGQAVLGYTRDAAKIGGLKYNGQLVPGMRADFVILNQDPFTSPSDQLGQVKVNETWLKGQCVYVRND